MVPQKVAVEHNNKNSDSLVKIEWFISKRCNFHCSYCSKYTHDHTSGFPDLDTMKSTLDKIMSTTAFINIKLNLCDCLTNLHKVFFL